MSPDPAESPGLSIGVGPTATPLLDETISRNLSRMAAGQPDADALIACESGLRLSYGGFGRAIDEVAKGLMALGVEKGDRVAIWSPNHPEWTITQYATAKIGSILVNVNPAYRTSALEYVLNQSGTSVLISAGSHAASDYRAMFQKVAERVPTGTVVYLDDPSDWQALLDRGTSITDDELAAREATLQPDDPINIQYTSGTTGFPKGATLSHHNILNNGFFVGELCGYDPTDRICIPVPFYHCFGMVLGNLACTTHGAAMVIPSTGFDAASVLQACATERCTSLYGVPTMFIAELAEPNLADYDLSSLRTGIMAGSPCPVEIMKRVVSDMNMDEVTIAYGMTETSPVSTQTSTSDSLDHRVSTVGRVHPHVEVKIVDPANGQPTQRGVSGELLTRGYSVMLGYWDDPERTAEAIDEDGWMHTGDLATMNTLGYVNIVGRIKDMIIRGGENVYPREIEEYLYSHPAVQDVQVIGVPDRRLGEEIMAWVQLLPGNDDITDEHLKDFCRGRIAHFKVPRYIKFVDDFPMTVTGKVQKFKMREQSIDELGLHEEASVQNA